MQKQIDEFKSYYGLRHNTLDFEEGPIPYSLIITPKNISDQNNEKKNLKKEYFLTILAVIHGNEVGGLFAMLKALSALKNNDEDIDKTICFVLGNIDALKANVRFIEHDLNRIFGCTNGNTKEHKRAIEIEKILAQSAYVLDIHQTNQPCLSPFFIFPYDKKTLSWLHYFNTTVPSAMHSNGQFSQEGLCSNEYVDKHQGITLTIELGMKGNPPEQVNLGCELIFKAYEAAQLQTTSKSQNVPDIDKRYKGSYYMENQKFIWEEGAVLVEGIVNFGPIKAGDVIMTAPGKEFLCKKDGYGLFPKYQWPKLTKTSEMCRIICPTTLPAE